MATLIRLKQIESGSALQASADAGTDFSQSVLNIVQSEVVAILPEGVISSSNQVDILQTTNFVEFSSSISNSFGDIYTELASITGSLETGLSASVALSFSQSNAIFTQFSQSIDLELSASNVNTNTIFNQLSQSVKLELSASNANTNTIFTQLSQSVNSELSSSTYNTNILINQLSQSVGLELSASSANTIQLFNELSSSVELQFSASNSNSNDISVSVNARLVNLEQFSSSLDNGFATDAELTLTSSQIIDQGEF